MQKFILIISMGIISLISVNVSANTTSPNDKRIAYLVSDLRIPFWDIMKRGIENRATELGYTLDVYSAENSTKNELKHTVSIIKDKVDGIIISPINSSSAVTILKLAKQANIPVVIADIGTEKGDYVSYVASDNHEGSYQLGKLLIAAIKKRQWNVASVGIIAIPQQRANGKARTRGFVKALNESGIKAAGIRQQVNFTYEETYGYTKELIAASPDMQALWLQGSNHYQAALDAITDAGKRSRILLICFDAEPEFLTLIPKGTLVGAGMQQPFLMGEKSVQAMDGYLNGQLIPKKILLPVLPVSTENISEMLPLIHRNVLAIEVN